MAWQAYIAATPDEAASILKTGYKTGRQSVRCCFTRKAAMSHGGALLEVHGLDEGLIDRSAGRILTNYINPKHLRPALSGNNLSEEPAVSTDAICTTYGCGKPTWNGRPGGKCARRCGGLHVHRLDALDSRFQQITHQFRSRWEFDDEPPPVTCIWVIDNPTLHEKYDLYCKEIGDVALHGVAKNPGNQKRRFHRTSMECQRTFSGTPCSSTACPACSIMREGFLRKHLNPRPPWKHYGVGFYSSPTSSYGFHLQGKAAADKFGHGAVLLCNVAVGVADRHDTTEQLPSGTHSRIASSTTGNPDDSELVVFDERAMVPRYLVLTGSSVCNI